jgi:hypothetical protein
MGCEVHRKEEGILAFNGSDAVLLNREPDSALYSFFRAVIGLSVDALQAG